ncbi:MAG: chromosome segregation protein SMC [Planctomycetales bacterium]|nr:chromosome segregation protein SMC [Planctomycetales bacterium]
MLKALELSGFKSFADKTRFDFPEGITVVVGPNGSGKSNIVDAIKWVLGEQSAKSLRGKDMGDVIFKGTGGRKPVNAAEATIIFDNSEGRLPIDAPEVHVSRRVYRSGEAEYLINRQPCRLKDIKDMFRGTGVGTDAYSLIEQGKVDRLLQASPRDRRAIFEEAAGISRFKAKKLQAQRRLERVEQNLLRLSDIVEEVEGRLRSIRAQASKARRYREYSDRLQQLRTFVGWTDWRQLTERIEGLDQSMSSVREEAEALRVALEEAEQEHVDWEQESARNATTLTELQQRESRAREQISTSETRCEDLRGRVQEYEQELAVQRSRLLALTGRADTAEQQLADNAEHLQLAERERHDLVTQVEASESRLSETSERLRALRRSAEQRGGALMASMRQAAGIGTQLSSCQTHLDSATKAEQQASERLGQLETATAEASAEFQQLQGREQSLATQQETLAEERKQWAEELAENRRLATRRADDVAELQGRCSGLSERAAVIEDLQRRFEGFSDGARLILSRAREATDGPYAEVEGVFADLMDAPPHVAKLIDAALGVAAQHIVLSGKQLIGQIERGELTLRGRVGLLVAEPAASPQLANAGDGSDDPLLKEDGVLGRADLMVDCPAEFRPVVRRMLGATYIVRDLAAARRLHRSAPPGTRLVTRDCELVEPEGSVVLGSQFTAGGLVSRRAELRHLREEIGSVQAQLGEARREVARLEQNIGEQAEQLDRRDAQLSKGQEELADVRVQRRTLQDRLEQYEQEQAEQLATRETSARDREQWGAELANAQRLLAETEARIKEIEQLNADELQVALELESVLRELEEDAAEARVAAATAEQRVESLRAQQLRYREDQQERVRAVQECRTQLHRAESVTSESERLILQSTAAIAQWYLDKEAAANEARRLLRRQHEIAAVRAERAEQQQQARQRIRRLEDKLHKNELDLEKLRHERDTQAQRLREDYDIDVSRMDESLPEEKSQRDEIEREIAELRSKINGIGAVNMEALAELDDLEKRFQELSGQYRDLSGAKDSLERIIHRINGDSRRLFVETLEAIRSNFQLLYRRAFGGGKADLVLEEGEDVLECGIDIVATPPGKPSFNNSLLSGGEKALTAVALLLAIFQFRPSPFCVLDEVDAPFDEANIDRFVAVLREFLGWTKFVVVTHSKKTMTAANTLYGITMQESGVSKRVSVRFEDVSDDGEISQEAIDRSQDGSQRPMATESDRSDDAA